MSLTGKTAIVTGGSRGIGRAVCLELARRGCNIVLSFAGNTAAADQTVSDCQALGVQAVTPAGEPTRVSDAFYGTTYSSSGAGWVRPDEIYTWVSPQGITVTAYPAGQPEPGVLYDESFLEKKDKYSMYLGGNKPLAVLENPQAEGGKLLVIRDSYADPLAPFLPQSYQEVHLFDVRYNLNSTMGIDNGKVMFFQPPASGVS